MDETERHKTHFIYILDKLCKLKFELTFKLSMKNLGIKRYENRHPLKYEKFGH